MEAWLQPLVLIALIVNAGAIVWRAATASNVLNGVIARIERLEEKQDETEATLTEIKEGVARIEAWTGVVPRPRPRRPRGK